MRGNGLRFKVSHSGGDASRVGRSRLQQEDGTDARRELSRWSLEMWMEEDLQIQMLCVQKRHGIL